MIAVIMVSVLFASRLFTYVNAHGSDKIAAFGLSAIFGMIIEMDD